jgi:hypothetical protein
VAGAAAVAAQEDRAPLLEAAVERRDEAIGLCFEPANSAETCAKYARLLG